MRQNPVEAIDGSITGPHGPVPIRRYAPAAPPGGTAPSTLSPTIVWLHGGGFFAGNLDMAESDAVARSFAAAGFRVVTVDYRLVPPVGSRWPIRRGAPTVRYPVPLDDVVAVVEQIQSESPDGVVLGGASAGACLAAATVARLAQSAGLPGQPGQVSLPAQPGNASQPLRGVFFIYGLFHAVFPAPPADLVRPTGRRRYTHAPAMLNLMSRNYAGSSDALSDPFAFPGGHPLPPFPRTLMIDADHDSIRASSAAFANELGTAGVDLDYRLIPGTQHAFLNRPNDPAFTEAVSGIVEWVGDIAAPRLHAE